MANKKHIHKYHRVKVPMGDGYLWACAIVGCGHHMPKHYESLLPGRLSVCWDCEDSFSLNDMNMKRDKPLCNDCDPTIKSIGEFAESKGIQ